MSLAISPTSATLDRKQPQQFTANQPVVWSVIGQGEISSTGLYKPPSAPKSGVVYIVARSAANPATSASATVTLTGR